MITRRHFTFAASAVGVGLGIQTHSAWAADAFPSKPVRIVVQYQAGGMTDTLARILAEPLGQRLGQPVVVENKPGASAIIGTDYVAKAPADGYTMLITVPAAVAANMVLFSKLPYDPRTDLKMLSDVAVARMALTVNADVPAKNFAELIALIKASPGKFNMGSWGAGTQPHQIQVFMDKTYGLNTAHVAYKGEAPMVADLVGGTIQMTVGSIASLERHIATGKLRPIAVVGNTRSQKLPNVPTFGEQGYADLIYTATGPISLMLPAQIPASVLEKLGKEVQAVIAMPDVQRRIKELGAEPVGNTPAQAAAAYADYWPVAMKNVRDTGAKLD